MSSTDLKAINESTGQPLFCCEYRILQRSTRETHSRTCKCHRSTPRIHPLATSHNCIITNGTNASIKINAEWFEPSIIWWLVTAARKGEKKTAALKCVRKPIED